MTGGAHYALARARAALPVLVTLAVVAAIASALLVGVVAGVRSGETAAARSAIAAASGDAALVTVTAPDADPDALRRAVADSLRARGAADVTTIDAESGVTVRMTVARVTGDAVETAGSALRALRDDVADAVDARVQVAGGLPATLETLAEGLQARRGPAAVAVALLAVVTTVVVGAVGLEPVRARMTETLLLRARGARRRGIAAMTALEVGVVSLAGALVGAAAALAVVAITSATTPGLLVAAAAAVAVALTATLVAVIVAARTADRRSSRADVAAFAGVAVVLAVLTALAAWRFAQAGTPVVSAGDATLLDPLVAVAPALILVLAALAAVLLATPAARAVATLLRASRGVLPVTPLRLVSRRPGRHALPIAAVAFAVGAATVAAGYQGSISALGDAPEAFRVGADVRVTTIPDTFAAVEVARSGSPDAAMLVRAFSAQGPDRRMPVLAAESAQLGRVMLDAGGTIDPAAIGTAIGGEAIGIPLDGEEVTFTVTADEMPAVEIDGEVLEQGAVPITVSLLFVSDGGAVWRAAVGNVRITTVEGDDGTFQEIEVRDRVTETVELPAGATWTLVGVDARIQFADMSMAVGDGRVTVSDVVSGGVAVDLATLAPAPGTPGEVELRADAVVLSVVPDGVDPPPTRAVVAGAPEAAPVVMTAQLASSLSLEVGDRIALEFASPDVEAEVTVADIIPVLPGAPAGEGILVDLATLSLLSPEDIVPNQAWLASGDAAAVAAAVEAAHPQTTVLVADPRSGRDAAGTAWGFVLAAAGTAVLALLVLFLRRTRTRADARELALLAVLGLGRRRAAGLRRAEDLFALAIGVVGGVVAGVVTATLIVPPLVRAAYRTIPGSYPVPLVWPWLPLAVALVGVVAACVAVVSSVRVPTALAPLVREDE